jgi:hypothetical protein
MTIGERLRTSIVAALIGASVAWLCTPSRMEKQERSGDGPRIHAAPDINNTPAPLLQVRGPAADDSQALALRRNLFAFADVQAPRPRVPMRIPIALQRPPEVAPVTVAVPEAPAVASPPLVFGYRFLGTFGPATSRIAAFAGNGEVLTAREGDQIGNFVLRHIGTEQVDLAALDRLATLRVNIAQ